MHKKIYKFFSKNISNPWTKFGGNMTMDLNKCDVICFDADYTLLRYANKEFTKLQYVSLSKCLIDCGVPSELLDMIDLEQINFIDMNGLIADFKTGYLLKIDSENTIYKAYFGHEEVKNLEYYGSPPKYTLKSLKYHEPDEHYIFLSHFTVGGAILWRSLVELVKQGKYNCENYIHLGRLFRKAAINNYLNEDLKTSHFYSSFFSNPETYLIKNTPQFKGNLQKLKNTGRKLVLITNSFYPYTNFMFNYCFGSDWSKYFDAYVYAAGKPDFFIRENELEIIENLNGKAYQKGSSTHLKRIIGGHKYAYIGDNYLADIYGSKQNNWVNVAIVQEIYFEKSINRISSIEEIENADYCRPPDTNIIDGFELWGSHFKDKESGKRNFWWDFVIKHSDYIIPDIDHIFELFNF